MPRVLIPADAPSINQIVDGYRANGWEAVKGTSLYYAEDDSFDLVHMFWPEEYCHWHFKTQKPTRDDVHKAVVLLDRWSKRSRLIMTVNNIHPHASANVANDAALYQAFYDRMEGFHHYSNASLNLTQRTYPETCHKLHVVTPGFSHGHLLPTSYDRAELRRALGLKDDDFVLLFFGAIRSADEFTLIRRSLELLRGLPIHTLLLSRLIASRRTLRGVLNQWRWKSWSRCLVSSRQATCTTGRVPDNEVYEYAIPADAIVIPRIDSLNSGLVFLGQTFGTTVIAPDHGSYPDQLAGTSHPIYETGNAQSLADAIAGEVDRKAAGMPLREPGHGVWSWQDITAACLNSLIDPVQLSSTS